jgi:predicted enzyme related to lactoylglutathione lyase
MAQARFRGRFVWQELMTEDTAAATAFYTKLLGWHAHASGGDPAYTELHAGHRGVGGMMKMPESAKSMGAKPMWMPYVSVDEVDAAVMELGDLGGKVVRPAMDIPNVGRFAVVSDPQGAVFAVIKPMGPPPPPPAPPQPGEFSWVELATTDHEAAFTFYSKLFGWEALGRHDMGPMGTYLIFGSDGIQRGGMFKMSAQQGSHPYWLPYASVADADASAKVVTAAGGRILNGPMDVPDGGRIVQLMDPNGVMFAIHSQTKPKMASPPAKPAAQTSPPPPPPKPAVPAAPKPAAAAEPRPAAKSAAPPPAAPKPAPAPPRSPPAPAAAPSAPAKTAAPKKPAAKKKPPAKAKLRTKKKPKKAAAPKKVAKKRKTAAKKSAAKAKKGKAKGSAPRSKRAKSAKRKSGKAKRKK